MIEIVPISNSMIPNLRKILDEIDARIARLNKEFDQLGIPNIVLEQPGGPNHCD